jgi:hypothetical protein
METQTILTVNQKIVFTPITDRCCALFVKESKNGPLQAMKLSHWHQFHAAQFRFLVGFSNSILRSISS